MKMDWTQAAVTSSVVIAGYVVTHIRTSARANRVQEEHKERLDGHEGRLNGHDAEFRVLDSRFVPRQELTQMMASIRESQKRTERWLERLILRRVPPITEDENGPDSL